MESHLLQMRGLKLKKILAKEIPLRSHLLQMRGLKQDTVIKLQNEMGRIFYRCVD